MSTSTLLASASLLLLLSPHLWSSCGAFVLEYPACDSSSSSSSTYRPSRAVARAGSGWVPPPGISTTIDPSGQARLASCRRCHSLPFESQERKESEEQRACYHRAYDNSPGATDTPTRHRRGTRIHTGHAMPWRRNASRRNRQLLRTKSRTGADSEGEVIDAEWSDIDEIVKADLASVGKGREDPEKKAARRKAKKMASKTKEPRAPAPAPGPFSFAGSGFTSLEDAVASGDFVDLSNGRDSCLKRVDEAGVESDGNPAKGSKIKVHYKMKVLGGDNIGSSGEDRDKPFEFILGRWPSEATHGWDKAVSAMRKGEVATLICGAQYAFGEAGAPPRIPPNATVETKLELVDWVDLAATYNAVPGKVETDKELRDRWSEELADGTSPMKDEAGLKKKMQEKMAAKAGTTPPNTDHRGKKIYDLKSNEAREIMAKQKMQGYTPDFGYVEKIDSFDLYIPVPEGTRAKDVTVEIHPDRMLVVVNGKGIVTKGRFHGKVALDGCYWLMSDLSLDPPGEAALGTQDDDVRFGPVYRGETCVQVFLEKMRPFDTLWETVYRPPEDDGDGGDVDSANRAEAAAVATD